MRKYTIEQIKKAGELGEISSIDVDHLISWLDRAARVEKINSKRPSKIKPYSDKRQKLNVVYATARKAFLNEKKVCEIRSPECTNKATCVHHVRGRGKYFLTMAYWKASCIACNNYVEQHDAWARENGFKESRVQ